MAEKEFSGERFVPEMNDPELEIEHLSRYISVQTLVEGLDVLDAACGEGYGSSILAEKAKSVVGIDIAAQTVQHAKEKYVSAKNVQYIQASIADLSMIETASKDAVISFETVEHVDRTLQEAFLKEIKRILKPEGFLIMSTPDKKEYSERYKFKNKFHVAEFYAEEFLDYLHSEFVHVELYNQYMEVATFIDRPHTDRDKILFVKDSTKYNPVGKYLIAIASSVFLPQMNISSVFMHHKETYLPTLDELNYCRQESITCRKKAEKLDYFANENKLQLEELERRGVELDKRMGVINETRNQLAVVENEKKLQTEELERRIAENDKKQQVIDEMQNRISLVEIEHKIQIGELQKEMKKLEERAISVENALRDLEQKNLFDIIHWYFKH